MWLLALLGCPESTLDDGVNDVSEGDADTDSDTDSDSDTDTDGSGSNDTDTDPGTGTDTDLPCDPAYVLPATDADADLTIAGPDMYARTAKSLLVVDHDGDGVDDLLIGAPDFDSLAADDSGRLWIVYGPVTTDGTVDVVADGWVDAASPSDRFAWQLANLGDLDGDGVTDIAAYAPDDGGFWIRYGSATRMSGGTSVASWDAWVTSGPVSGDPVGEGVNSAGDLDGDGDDEIVFANPWWDSGNSDAGRVYVLPGSPVRLAGDVDETPLPSIDGTEDDRMCSGACIDAADFDGDGLQDLAIAADAINFPGTSKIWVRYGDGSLPDGESVEYYPRMQTSSTDGVFGNTLAFVGDLDGDGYTELAVGDELASTQLAGRVGHVWLLRGGFRWVGNSNLDGAAWATIEGAELDSYVGTAIQGLGDLDCDGSDDLAIGAQYAEGVSDQAGVVSVWLPPTAGAHKLDDATAQILGVVGSGGFGGSLATGDLNGNGVSDLVVGAPEYALATGRAYLFLDVL